jgi:hypothetical protein
LESFSLKAEKVANSTSISESILKEVQKCRYSGGDALIKDILIAAYEQNSPHCNTLLIENSIDSFICIVKNKLDEGKANNTSINESISSPNPRYEFRSFNGTTYRDTGLNINEKIPSFCCTHITSKLRGEENFSVIIILHCGERMYVKDDESLNKSKSSEKDVTEIEYFNLLNKLIGIHNSSFGLLITTENFTNDAFNNNDKIKLINGDKLVEILVDLRIGVKPVYELYNIDYDYFFWKHV